MHPSGFPFLGQIGEPYKSMKSLTGKSEVFDLDKGEHDLEYP